MKKFELTTEQKINWFGRTLFRIKACIDFVTVTGEEVHAGDLGGFVEKESNLSQYGNAWVSGNAKVSGNAEVWGDAFLFSTRHIFNVTPIGEYAQSLTIFRSKNHELQISFDCVIYSVDEFLKMIHERWDGFYSGIAEDVVNVAKKHIDLN